jgi:hypothetical protein
MYLETKYLWFGATITLDREIHISGRNVDELIKGFRAIARLIFVIMESICWFWSIGLSYVEFNFSAGIANLNFISGGHLANAASSMLMLRIYSGSDYWHWETCSNEKIWHVLGIKHRDRKKIGYQPPEEYNENEKMWTLINMQTHLSCPSLK